jgi:hypothetical protein
VREVGVEGKGDAICDEIQEYGIVEEVKAVG